MRSFVALALVASAAVSAPAMAQSTGTVDINGSVGDRCLFTSGNAVISVGELTQGGASAAAGRLDPSKLNGQSRTLVGWCNGTAATMAVEALPLVNTSFASTAPVGFDTRIDYTASAAANGVTGTDSSVTAGAGTAVSVGLFSGNINVSLASSSTPNSGLLVAGAYSGQVIVTLTPNISFGPAS